MGCNRTGSDKYGDYPTGMTSIFDNLGEDIRETRRNGHIYALLDLTNLKEENTSASLRIAPPTVLPSNSDIR